MAKKRTTASETSLPSAGAAPARRRTAKRSTTETAPAGTVSVPAANGAASVPDRDEIARLAYSYWLARGGHGGSPEDDWFRAEQELRARRSATAA
jgi:hypothetical protein